MLTSTYVQLRTLTYTYVHLRTLTYTYVHLRLLTYSGNMGKRPGKEGKTPVTYTYVHLRTLTYTYVHLEERDVETRCELFLDCSRVKPAPPFILDG